MDERGRTRVTEHTPLVWKGERTDTGIGVIYGGFPVTSMNSRNSIRSLNGNVIENRTLLEVKSSI